MNKSKKVIRAILTLILGVAVLAMTACGDSANEELKAKYIGYWKAVTMEIRGETYNLDELGSYETYLDIRGDGIAEGWLDGENSGVCKWELTGDGITITNPDGWESTAILDGKELIFTMQEKVFVFEPRDNIPYLEDGGKNEGNSTVTDKTIKMTNSEGDIELIKYEVIRTHEQKPMLRVYFKTKNKTNETVRAGWKYDIKAYQDGVELETGWAYDDNEAEDNRYKKVQGGVELEVAYGFELSNQKTPVTIRVEDYSDENILDDVYQEMVIELK